MEHNTDRILWTVLVLAIGVALYVAFRPAVNGLMGQVTEKIQGVVNGVDSTLPAGAGAIFLPFF